MESNEQPKGLDPAKEISQSEGYQLTIAGFTVKYKQKMADVKRMMTDGKFGKRELYRAMDLALNHAIDPESKFENMRDKEQVLAASLAALFDARYALSNLMEMKKMALDEENEKKQNTKEEVK